MEFLDLRKGNLLQDELGRVGEIISIKNKMICVKMTFSKCTQHFHNFKPVSITEDLLLYKLNFKVAYKSDFRLKLDYAPDPKIGFDFSSNPGYMAQGLRFYDHYITHIKYAHELQNAIYYLLNNECKLTVNYDN